MPTINLPAMTEKLLFLYGISFEKLVTPVSDEAPSGLYLRYEDLYFDIKKARTRDDDTLPVGIWEHDLKKAEWSRVIELAGNALAFKTKDVQLAVWLLEAGIYKYGFAGIAPALFVIENLCSEFWDTLHPNIEFNDLEFRINPIIWANEKLIPALRLIPFIPTVEGERPYTWADWLKANASVDKKARTKDELSQSAMILNGLTRMSSTDLQALQANLDESLLSTVSLNKTLNHLCGADAPSLANIENFLTEVRGFLGVELKRRGMGGLEASGESDDPIEEQNFNISSDSELSAPRSSGRNETYMQVEKAAQTLLQIDPHSPAPYLILQACRWGTMDTRELYKELFVECGGQLNIFDLLGVDSRAMTDLGA
ncbi:type VI secretion system protein TssA [Teredinibacter sp. KSP-S5-2]|uniref:type VI secretion system protein TssA n=1 Tax=Teredinibacter sp. KSP-S5-2 TaxID=3034506 RepID=UPI0029350614|nr:type VI secretion system protein TssA [Teredinibacter sp. KSP-S5-2]WNO11625.1 type VI secretion system protein TssA [Teredinibacter sp. KSP-S5-2]